MLRYFLKRILMLIPVLLAVSFLIFTMMYFTPGDPAKMALGDTATEEQLAQWRTSRELDKPFFEQFFDYVWGIVSKGDFGVSYKTGKNVTSSLIERFPTTFVLAVATSLLAMVLGILLGVFAANHQNTWIDNLLRVIGMAGVSMPIFWLGLLMIMTFAVKHPWFPVSGWYGPRYIVLPAVTMGLTFTASLMRTTRASMLDCIRQDYVTTARAKGQKEAVITWHHVFRNALIPIITAAGSTFGIALCGAVITEQVFSIPGLGSLMVNAITTRDYPLVRGSVILLATSFSVVNLLIDMLYATFDPRIRAQFAGKTKNKKLRIKIEKKKRTING
ncbi:MAG: ABC transporter permease [Stomatobaculum sp.]